MHPYMARALAAQQIREWQHDAAVARRAAQAHQPRRAGRIRLTRRATTASGTCGTCAA